MNFTGERFIPTEQGEIKLEHYHRYALAMQLVADKDVLDVACGEGYGSSMLARHARKVVGIDVSIETITHAKATYSGGTNLEFLQGSASSLGLPDDSFDIVISFETVEHLREQEQMLAEIRRVLRPGGILVMSSPNRPVYSDEASHHNEFHVKELDFAEFDVLLKAQFPQRIYWGQRLAVGSSIVPMPGGGNELKVLIEADGSVGDGFIHAENPVYFIAICGAETVPLPSFASSMFFTPDYDLLKQYHAYAKWAKDLEGSLKDTQAQCARIEAEHLRVATWATELNGIVLARDSEIRQINEVAKDRAEKIKELQAKSDEVEAVVSRHVQNSAEKDRLIKEREKEISTLNMKVQEKDAQVDSLGEANAALHAKVREQDSLIAEIRGKLIESECEYQRIVKKISTLSMKMQEKDIQVDSLGEANSTLRAKVREQDSMIAEIRSKLIESECEYQRIVRWTRDLQGAVVERDSLISELNARGLVRLSNAIRNMRARISSALKVLHAVPRAVAHHRPIYKAVPRAIRVVARDGVAGLVHKVAALDSRSGNQVSPKSGFDTTHGGIFGFKANASDNFLPKVSVIVPNYNHGKYLRDRLESIYNQTYTNIEVILLDDCSTDDSKDILNEYASIHPEITICSFNSINSGGVFNQWKKGLRLATGDLIWIAESDDYCTSNFLDELVEGFVNSGVMLSFCRTEFVLGTSTQRIWSTEEYLAQFDDGIWAKPFVKSAHALVNEMWSVKNIVPNVSSAIFRNPGHIDLLEDSEWMSLRLCGDWIFYLTIVRGGLVTYKPWATNFYRQHPSNTSVNAQKEEVYYREHEVVSKRLVSMYKVDIGFLNKQRDQLREHWLGSRGAGAGERFNELYDLVRIQAESKFRKPNVMIAVYSLAAGGGETLPLVLANLLKSKGYAVTVLNCAQAPTEMGVRAMLDRSIPLIELDRLDLAEAAVRDMGVELVHSHHAWVDVTLSTLLANSNEVRQVVTMHGMYEMLDKDALGIHLGILDRRVDRFVYTARKNLDAFDEDFRKRKGFVRIDNALARGMVQPAARADLGISETDFVLCMVARAIPEKGWEEAIDAVVHANEISSKRIHLLLIGQGQEAERLNVKGLPDFIHFLGFKKNIRDYFAMADVGFIPSRFQGESFPLVLIDCLYAGRPLLASAVGEIEEMLSTDDGMAGEVFELKDWAIDVGPLSAQIANLASDGERYARMLAHVPAAADKFDPEAMCERYEAVYKSCLQF